MNQRKKDNQTSEMNQQIKENHKFQMNYKKIRNDYNEPGTGN
jgi:hypothetical protein